jgi:pSer/pThr/pTyr-binding forkhead associated (FHA) protein
MQHEIKAILFKFTEGNKRNQIEEFSFDQRDQITLGRSAGNDIRFESGEDDMVSREHAVIKISSDDKVQFTLTDNGSTNGTFVNGEKLTGSRKLLVGDKVQLGKNGPVFEFDLNPAPDHLIQKTRIMDVPKATMVMDTPSDPGDMDHESSISPSTPLDVKSGVGKGTVERMIHKERSKNRNVLYIVGALLLVIVAAGLWFVNKNAESGGETVFIPEKTGMSPDEIALANREKVVYIEVGWKLLHTPTGQEIFHVFPAPIGADLYRPGAKADRVARRRAS